MARKTVSLTHQDLLAAMDYDRDAGAFYAKRGGVWGHGAETKRVDYIDRRPGHGGRFVDFKGWRHSAARLAWFYINGEWPDRRMQFLDGDRTNIAIDNLGLPKFDLRSPEGRSGYQKQYRADTPDQRRNENYKRKYGDFSVADYQAKFVAQNGCCAGCLKPEVEKRNGQLKWLAVDHDHETGKIRDLLCTACNTAIGKVREDPIVLRRLAAYLERHAGVDKSAVPLRLASNSDGSA